jgi:UDP-N-acetylmuramate dehydrogenase
MDLPFPHQKEKLLSEYSTFGIGGPARYFATASEATVLQQMLLYAHQHNLPLFILGKGSNTLFDDRGFNGLVIQNRIDYLKQAEGIFSAGSGYSFPRLGGIASRAGWQGLEFASGIPATVGGAIFMNAGANGQETSHCLVEVHYITEQGEMICFKKEELQFNYRKSSFQQWKGAIVEGIFHLKRSELAKKHQKELLDYRLKTQPYRDKSAGCAFRNPEGGSAGKLIDACGLKGFSVGGACVSPMHANFIVNRGGARAQDVLDLMMFIKEKVHQENHITLEEEIRYIPYG